MKTEFLDEQTKIESLDEQTKIESLIVYNELLVNELRLANNEIKRAHALLNRLKVPLNGINGKGKRQELSLAQRINEYRYSHNHK